MDSTPITQQTFYRQDSAPSGVPDGSVWVTDADGSGDDTNARYVFNAAADRWELDSAVGPSEPSLGTPVAGALWRDTSNGSGKQYDGTAFVTLSPSQTLAETRGAISVTTEKDVTLSGYETFHVKRPGTVTTDEITVDVENPQSYGSDDPDAIRLEQIDIGSTTVHSTTSTTFPFTVSFAKMNGLLDVTMKGNTGGTNTGNVVVSLDDEESHTHPL